MANSNELNKNTICVAGVYLKSDKYPNVKYKILALKRLGLDFLEIHCPGLSSDGGWGRGSLLLKTLTLMLASIRAVFAIIVKRNKFSAFYIPYPGITVCLLLSLIPKRLRPKYIVLDLFISMYDTVVLDRKIFSQNSMVSKLVYNIELKSLSVVDKIVVDTRQNLEFYSSMFKFPEARFSISSLSIGWDTLVANTPEVDEGANVGEFLEVLFVGTMVPLHGIEQILSAAEILKEQKVRFTIVGDGQQSYLVEDYIRRGFADNVVWVKEWKSQIEVANLIENSDVCLGIFSSASKAQRVCPLKLYHYLRSGKAIITGETNWVRGLGLDREELPFFNCFLW